jgi:hypothetical protein
MEMSVNWRLGEFYFVLDVTRRLCETTQPIIFVPTRTSVVLPLLINIKLRGI